jgi:hypothetical protein
VQNHAGGEEALDFALETFEWKAFSDGSFDRVLMGEGRKLPKLFED